MTLTNMVALFLAMTALAIVPSTSVLLVVAKSTASGFKHGLATAIGILFGDFFFILFAIYSLSAIASKFANLFVLVKYLGAAYLIWLGTKLCLNGVKSAPHKQVDKTSYFSSFLSGLSVTLVDSKAILFYISFFPAFVDLENISILDTAIVMAIATFAIGGAKISYAYLADRLKTILDGFQLKNSIDLIAGSIMICTGIILVIRS